MTRLKAESNLDFDGVTDLIHRLLKAAWGDDWGTFCEAFPNGRDPNSIPLPVITYALQEMVPGTVGNSNTREIKPRIRAQYTPEESTDENPISITVYGQTMDCQIVFECWEENNAKATQLSKRFKDFMNTYTGYMMQMGLQQMVFQSQTNIMDVFLRENAVSRKLTFHMRIEDQYIVPSDTIAKVTGIVSASYDTADDSIKQSQIDFKLP